LLFPAAIARLVAFGSLSAAVPPPPGAALFCSWGAYDFNQLAADCRRHGIAMPFSQHWNLKEGYAMRSGSRKRLGMMAALRSLGLSATGTHHRGIDDARNIARMLPYILGHTCVPEPIDARGLPLSRL
jgi:inhibitor of KinA sporulation pathway (predicted exonuclease)